MPRFLLPKKSTQHRVAAIALYRALLQGCSSAALPDDARTSLRNAIQNKFRKNRKISSPYQLGLVFKAGYETLDHLDASGTSDAASVGALTRLISTLPLGLTRAPPTRRPPPPPPPPKPLEKHPLANLPPEKAVLNVRPYAKVSGPRHVPVIASANGIPFLRLTKPQPPSLSRVIQQKLKRRMSKFHEKIELLNYWLPMAKQEDQWDTLITAQTREREDKILWVDAIYLANNENSKTYEAEAVKDREAAEKMQRIIDLETELALKEGQTVRRGRKNKPLSVLEPPSA